MKKERSYSKGVILFSLEKRIAESQQWIESLQYNIDLEKQTVGHLKAVYEMFLKDDILPVPENEEFDFDQVAKFPFTDFGELGGSGNGEEEVF